MLGALAGIACGGRVEPGGDGGSSSGSSSGSATARGCSGGGSSSSVTVPPCPSEPPTAGARCVAPGQQACAYVNTGRSCQAFVCDDSGVWQSTPAGC